MIHQGKCELVLPHWKNELFDAIVTDPPYGLGNREPTAEEIDRYLSGASLGVLKEGRQHCANSVLRSAVVPKSDNSKSQRRKELISFKVVVRLRSLVAVGPIQLNDQIQLREEEVHSEGSIGHLDHLLVDKGDPRFTQGSNHGQLCLRERQRFTGCVGPCGCFATVRPSLVRMIVRLVDDTTGEAEGSTLVVAGRRTEVKAVLTLDLRRGTGELVPADAAYKDHPGLLLSPPEDVGAPTGARGLFAPLKALLSGKVGDVADGALSFDVTLPRVLVDRFHSPYTAHKDFMGADWEIPPVSVWRQCYRLLKPGRLLFAFGGSRTFDLIDLGIQAAGFNKLGTLLWVYSQGWPKGGDISKRIDKAKGVEPTIVGPDPEAKRRNKKKPRFNGQDFNNGEVYQGAPEVPLTEPTSEEAQLWKGWGSSLKPAWEPIVVYSKGDPIRTVDFTDPFFYCPKAARGETTLKGEIENDHPTKKPVKLMRHLVSLAADRGELVLDPYFGSGTTGVACIHEDVRFDGIEMYDPFWEIAVKRCQLVHADVSSFRGQQAVLANIDDFEDDEPITP